MTPTDWSGSPVEFPGLDMRAFLFTVSNGVALECSCGRYLTGAASSGGTHCRGGRFEGRALGPAGFDLDGGRGWNTASKLTGYTGGLMRGGVAARMEGDPKEQSP